MLFVLKLYTSLKRLSSNNIIKHNRPNKKPSKFKVLINRIIKVLKTKILTKNFLIHAIIIISTGLLLRFFINEKWGINVFIEYKNIISIYYYTFMALFSQVIKELMAELFTPLMMMEALGDNPPGGNQAGGNQAGGNPPGGNVPAGNQAGNPPYRAGNINGPIQVNNPNNQNYVYQPNQVNQPLIGNIARSLDYQASIGLTSLSRYTFTPDQEQYILTFLLHNHRPVYDNIMLNQPGNINQPQWWKQSNTKKFRDLLRNAR